MSGLVIHLRCPIHTHYKAVRRPTADCEYCRKMWDVSPSNEEVFAFNRNGKVVGFSVRVTGRQRDSKHKVVPCRDRKCPCQGEHFIRVPI